MSKNYLTTLDGVRQLRGLSKLSAADNCLADFAALNGLQEHAQTLVAVNLEGNPVAMLPNYRSQVGNLAVCGSLQLSRAPAPLHKTGKLCGSSNLPLAAWAAPSQPR